MPAFGGTFPNAHLFRWADKRGISSPRSEATLGEVDRPKAETGGAGTPLGFLLMTLEVGAKAPDFELRNQRREKVSLEDLKGSKSALVFIPFAFTSTCERELCEIRDKLEVFEEAGTRVVAITCDTAPTNARWAQENGFEFDILSDFWPHGEVSRRYDTFNETFGYAERTTYFIDESGTITDVVRSDELREARPFAHYEAALRG